MYAILPPNLATASSCPRFPILLIRAKVRSGTNSTPRHKLTVTWPRCPETTLDDRERVSCLGSQSRVRSEGAAVELLGTRHSSPTVKRASDGIRRGTGPLAMAGGGVSFDPHPGAGYSPQNLLDTAMGKPKSFLAWRDRHVLDSDDRQHPLGSDRHVATRNALEVNRELKNVTKPKPAQLPTCPRTWRNC